MDKEKGQEPDGVKKFVRGQDEGDTEGHKRYLRASDEPRVEPEGIKKFVRGHDEPDSEGHMRRRAQDDQTLEPEGEIKAHDEGDYTERP
jgi:hypothetical protein